MANEDRIVGKKGARAKNMVRVDMAHDHIFDRQVCGGGDRGATVPGAIGKAAARIGHEHRVTANDKADIRNGVRVGAACVLVVAPADKNAGLRLLPIPKG